MVELMMFFWPVVIIVALWIASSLIFGGLSLYYGDGGHSVRHIQFIQSRQRDGASYFDIKGEVSLRIEFAQLRREASRAVSMDIDNWYTILEKAKAASMMRVKLNHPALMKIYEEFIASMSYGHILYSREADRVDALMMDDGRGAEIDIDVYAAFMER